MALVQTDLVIDAPAEAVWQLVTDWTAHSRWIPLTTVTIDPGSPAGEGLGTRFTGRTQLGPVGFDDPMEVTQWLPPSGDQPGRCRVLKHGRWLTGWAEIHVEPIAGSSRLVWVEEIQPRWTPRFASPVVALVGSMLFGRTIRKLAAELRRAGPS